MLWRLTAIMMSQWMHIAPVDCVTAMLWRLTAIMMRQWMHIAPVDCVTAHLDALHNNHARKIMFQRYFNFTKVPLGDTQQLCR